MAQVATITQVNGSGFTVRNGFNGIIEALASMNSGTSGPNINSLRGYSWWADTSLSPAEIKLRNAANTAWIKVAEVLTGPDQLRFFSEGAAVLISGAQTFDGNLTIDIVGSLGEMLIGSDQSSGSTGQITLFGHNSAAEDVSGVQVKNTVVSNTDGAESFSLDLAVRRLGTLANRLVLGDVATFSVPVDATILRQGGVDLDTIINNALDSLDSTEFSITLALTQGMSGFARTFTGASPVNITVPRLTKDSHITIHNNGTAALTFVTAANPNDVTFQNGVTLGVGQTATLVWIKVGASAADNQVRILGGNT